jgi:hypothetical protein
VQAPSNASTLERLGSGVLLPHVHETWHLMLGNFDLLATEGSEGDICRCRMVSRSSLGGGEHRTCDFEDHGEIFYFG